MPPFPTLFLAAILFVAPVPIPASSGARNGVQDAAEPVRRALLVGVEDYPRASGWTALRGPVSDVEVLRSALVGRGGFRPADVVVLLDEDATRAAIGAAFAELAERSRPGDVLLFYFAGHGSRLPDQDGDESDGWDETLVPFDAADATGRPNDLRDDELYEWVRAANERTEHVVLVFDCCSAGTNVRGSDDAVRYVDPKARGIAGTRASAALDAGSGLFRPGLSYVSLAACRAAESAYEHRVPIGSEERVHGLFTWCLVTELNRSEGSFSYAGFADRVRRSVQRIRPGQTPVAEGPLLTRAFLAEGLRDAPRGFPLLPEGAEHVLHAGQAHGLREGWVLELEREEGFLGRSKGSPGRVVVVAAGLDRSRVRWLEGVPQPGARYLARPAQAPAESTALGVSLAVDVTLPAEAVEPWKTALSALEGVALVPAERARYAVHLDSGDGGPRFRLAQPGSPAALCASLPGEGSDLGLRRLSFALRRLATARRLFEELSSETHPELAIGWEVERSDFDGNRLGPLERDAAGIPVVKPGEILGVSLENRSPVSIYAYLLLFSPDGQVALLHESGPDDALAPGRSIPVLLLELGITPGSEPFYERGRETFRWIVSTRPLENLAALEQGSATAFEAGNRSAAEEAPAVLSDPEERLAQAWLTQTFELRVAPDRVAPDGVAPDGGAPDGGAAGAPR